MSTLLKSTRATLQFVSRDLQGGLSMMFRRMNPLKDLTGPFQLSDLSKDSFHESYNWSLFTKYIACKIIWALPFVYSLM